MVGAGALGRLERDVAQWDRWLDVDANTLDHLARVDWGYGPGWAAARDRLYRDFYGVMFYWRRHWTADGPYGAKDVFTCDAFDPVARTCGIHETRPGICSEFPWYGRKPDGVSFAPGTSMDAASYDCSYWLDTPGWAARGRRPLLPVSVA